MPGVPIVSALLAGTPGPKVNPVELDVPVPLKVSELMVKLEPNDIVEKFVAESAVSVTLVVEPGIWFVSVPAAALSQLLVVPTIVAQTESFAPPKNALGGVAATDPEMVSWRIFPVPSTATEAVYPALLPIVNVPAVVSIRPVPLVVIRLY